MSQNFITSPCIGWCRKNHDEVCQGCGRTLDEIADWYLANDRRKQQIVAVAAERLSEMPDAYQK